MTKREKTEKSSRQVEVEVEVGAKRGTTKIVTRSAKNEEAKAAKECGANNEKMKSFEKGLWRKNEEKELTCTMAGNEKNELREEKESTCTLAGDEQKELRELTGTEAGNYSRVDIEEIESTKGELTSILAGNYKNKSTSIIWLAIRRKNQEN